MPQQIIVTNDEVRVVEAGPVGPRGVPGPPGPAGAGITVTGAGTLTGSVLNIPIDAGAATGSARTLGSGPNQAAPGDSFSKSAITNGFPIKPDLDSWFTKLTSATAAAPVDVVIVTDSLGAQGSLSDLPWPWRTAKYINEFMGASAYPYPVYAGSPDASTTPIAISTGSTGVAVGLGGHSANLADGGTVSYTATCTKFRVTYCDTGTGTLTIRDGVGGPVLTTITYTNTGAFRVWESGTLTNTAHTLYMTSSGTTNVGQIIPMGTIPVNVHFATHAGWSSADFTTDTTKVLDLIEWLETNKNLGLVLLATGANDSPYSTMMPALISAVQARTNEDIVVWVPYPSTAVDGTEYAGVMATVPTLGVPTLDSGTFYRDYRYNRTIDGTHPLNSKAREILSHQVNAFICGDPLNYMLRNLATAPSIGTSGDNAAPGDILVKPLNDSFKLVDEFILGDPTTSGSIGELKWIRTGGASEDPLLEMEGHPGAVRIKNTAASSPSTLHLKSNAGFLPTDNFWIATFYVRHGGLGSGAKYIVGFGPQGGNFLHGTALVKTSADSYWHVSVMFVGTELTNISTGISTAQNQWFKVTMRNFGTAMLVSINDSTPINVTTYVVGSPYMLVDTTSSTSYFDIDRFEYINYGISREA